MVKEKLLFLLFLFLIDLIDNSSKWEKQWLNSEKQAFKFANLFVVYIYVYICIIYIHLYILYI